MYSSLSRLAALSDTALLPSSDVDVRYKRIPDGDAGAAATVGEMAELITAGSTNPIVRRQAVTIASTVPVRDYAAQIGAIRQWVATHVVFLRDPEGIELLHEPELLVSSILRNGQIHIDCDDVAILAGAIGKAIGLLTRIVTVAFIDPSMPNAVTPYAHTWVELSSPVDLPRWVDMDTTRAAQRVDPSLINRHFIVDV